MVDATRALSFGSIAEEYDRLRPHPAPEAVRWMVPDDCAAAVDVAAGTGLFTRAVQPLVDHVIAVEPDERMREVLTERSPGVDVRAGSGEQIPVPDAYADLVTVSSAWHWLDPERATTEIARVLRDGGRLGVVWTRRDRDDWLRGLDLERYGLRRGNMGHGAEDRTVQLPPGSPFTAGESAHFSYVRQMPKDDVVATLATYSPVIALDEQTRAGILDAARAALDERFPSGSTVGISVTSHCWRAERLPR